ncbi:DUF1345 domain-containing protein [Streptomyces parvus]|uniref:DUF1345 domain-containing protein n=1 Tax=Streptomyces parvus TaxID=66428 RepID=UPI0033FA3F42
MHSRCSQTARLRWLSERWRFAVSASVSAVAVLLLVVLEVGWSPAVADVCVVGLLLYLLPYLFITVAAFAAASPESVLAWASRGGRGTVLQRYLYGTAPGPGSSFLIGSAALVVAVLWRPGHLGSSIAAEGRALTALSLVVLAWMCIAMSFAAAFQADNLVDGGRGLDFPGEDEPCWMDYVYFSFSVMTTFGTTDVTVTSQALRRTVMVHGVIAFVFNTVTLASLVSALSDV